MSALQGKRILLTGAAGGIGSLLAERLLAKHSRLVLVDRDESGLQTLQQRLGKEDTLAVAADITRQAEILHIVDEARQGFGGVDILINAAGINPFGAYVQQQPELIRRTLEINTLAPMLLAHAVLPDMIARGDGQIVNIGSTFGSIGFAWFSAYSTSKFGLRGFSQALRRELADSGIVVSYIAPRAVRTAINSPAVYEMAELVKMNIDEPEYVVEKMVQAVEQRRKECYIGFPESFFARLNALLPGLVDAALRKQNRLASRYVDKPDDG